MRKYLKIIPLTLLAMASVTSAQTPTTRPSIIVDQPVLKMGSDGQPDASFLRQHENIMAKKNAGPIDLLFLGDSITANWAKAPAVWKSHFAQYKPANFGIGGDATQHVLWRIQQGELDGLHPKAVVLLIGGNNHLQAAPKMLSGIHAVIDQVHAKLPTSRVLLLALLPRGADPTDTHAPKTGNVPWVRANNAKANAELAKLDDGDRVRFLDLGDIFVDAKGYISADLMADALHPTPAAYALMADRMQPIIDQMMKAPAIAAPTTQSASAR